MADGASGLMGDNVLGTAESHFLESALNAIGEMYYDRYKTHRFFFFKFLKPIES